MPQPWPRATHAVRRALAASAALALLVGAREAAAQTLVQSDLSLSGTLDGAAGGGYSVRIGTLSISDGSLSNFITTGGAGSGGGAGLGGAIFVGPGAAAVLNNLTISGNAAVGGLGGTTSLTGGALNGLFTGAPGSFGVGGAGGSDGGVGGAGGAGGTGGFGAGGGGGGMGGAGSPQGAGGSGGAGGFGGGVGNTGIGLGQPALSGGGGGSGFGGAVFVTDGGTLTVSGDTSFSLNSVTAGSSADGGASGLAAGSDLFMMQGSSVTLAPGAGHVITFNGSIADDSAASIPSAIPAGQGAGLTIGEGLVVLNGANTYSGATVLQGVLRATDGQGLPSNSNLTFQNGVLEGSGAFTRSVGTAGNQVQWIADGGFAAIGGGLTVSLGGNAPLLWGANGFVPASNALVFGDATATASVTFTNPIDLNGGTRTVTVRPNADNTDMAILSGVLSDGTLTVNGDGSGGTLVLTAANTYAGGTLINGGRLALSGAGSIAASAYLLDYGVFDISGADAGTSVTSLAGSGGVALGSRTLTITGGYDSFAGVISGAGGLTVLGGAQGLSGQSTYTGPTTIAAGGQLSLTGAGSIAASSDVIANGLLDISATSAGASIASLSGDGRVALGAETLTVAMAHDSFAGSIGGSGGLAILGGTETLTGTSTYTGGTTVSNATLAINGDAALGAPAGGLSLANATLRTLAPLSSGRPISLTGAGRIDTAGATVSLTGVVSGSGSLVADGGGRLTLTGSNSYAGGTVVTGSTTLAVGADAALGAAGGGVVVASGRLVTLADMATSRAITVLADGVIDSQGYRLDLYGPVLYQQVPVFTGTAHVTGPLVIDSQGLLVPAAATLHGVGNVSAPTLILGTLSPGNSPGTLTFSAPVTMTAGSTFVVNIDGTGTGTGAGNYSRTLLTGPGSSFTAGGATLLPVLRGITGSATNSFVPTVGESFVVLQADGGVVGSFSGLTQPASGLPAGSRFDALTTPSTVTLYLTPATYTNLTPLGVTLTANQAAVGAALDALRPAPGVRTDPATTATLAALFTQTAAGLPAVMNTLGGTVYGDALLGAMESQRVFGDVLDAQLNARRTGVGNAAGEAVFERGHTIWATGLGSNVEVGRGGGTGYHLSSAGFAAGADARLPHGVFAGFAVGNSEGTTTSPATGGRADVTVTSLAGYGGWSEGRVFVDAQAGLDHEDMRMRRNLIVFGLSAQGHTDGWGGSGRIDTGLRYQLGRWQVGPAIGLQVDQLGHGAVGEDAAGLLGLSVRDDIATSVQSRAGLRAEASYLLGGSYRLTPTARLSYLHEFADVTTTTAGTLAGAPATPIVVQSARSGRDGVLGGLGVSLTLPQQLSAYMNYLVEARQNATGQGISGGLRWNW